MLGGGSGRSAGTGSTEEKAGSAAGCVPGGVVLILVQGMPQGKALGTAALVYAGGGGGRCAGSAGDTGTSGGGSAGCPGLAAGAGGKMGSGPKTEAAPEA